MMSGKQMKKKLEELKRYGMMSAPTNSTRFYCDICKMAFTSATALITHGQKVHGR